MHSFGLKHTLDFAGLPFEIFNRIVQDVRVLEIAAAKTRYPFKLLEHGCPCSAQRDHPILDAMMMAWHQRYPEYDHLTISEKRQYGAEKVTFVMRSSEYSIWGHCFRARLAKDSVRCLHGRLTFWSELYQYFRSSSGENAEVSAQAAASLIEQLGFAVSQAYMYLMSRSNRKPATNSR